MSNRREFLLLADTFNADKHDPVGMIGSEKLDGNRCLWDGGVTRGVPTIEVPWASTRNPKTGKVKDKIKPLATGLWSRYGNPIQAPDWFLDGLPPEPLDGELYTGRGNFQLTQSIVRLDDPNAGDWTKVKFTAFGAPTLASVFTSGVIKNANMYETINAVDCAEFFKRRGRPFSTEERTYAEELDMLAELYGTYWSGQFDIVDTQAISSMEQLQTWVNKVCALGGEGVMLREADSVWYPKRRPFLLKVKPRHDAECTVVGFVAGKQGKTGQFLGKLGTLECEWSGSEDAPCGVLKTPVKFEIGTGLTHEQRELHPEDVANAVARPGKPLLGLVSETPHFMIGDTLTFSYMGVTDDNAPREPAYLRKFS